MSDSVPAETKPLTEEAVDDLERFDAMERDFHKVVQEIAGDRSLDSFREQYERLHNALQVSHGHNTALLDRCRTMNLEILSNANKVSSVLQLSQNDQRTIAGLRHEFEKAWKLVEVSQERENKSREIIDTLKVEVSDLSRLVEQGGTMALTQESSLQEIADSTASLKKEIAVQTVQLQSMEKDVVRSHRAQGEMRGSLEDLVKTHDELVREIDIAREESKAASADSEKLHQDMDEVKANYHEMQQQGVDIEKAIKQQKHKLVELTSDLHDRERDIKSLAEDKRLNAQTLHLAVKLLEDRKVKNSKFETEKARFLDTIEGYEERKKKFLNDAKEAALAVSNTQAALAEAKMEKDAIASEKARTRAQLTRCQNEVFTLANQNTAADGAVQAERRGLERRRVLLHDLLSTKGSEHMETKVVEGQTTILTNELLGEKVGAHSQRSRIEQIHREIEEYQSRASGARSNTIQVQEEIRMCGESLDEMNIHLSKVLDSIKREDSQLTTIQHERDFASRQVELSNADNHVLQGDNKALTMLVRELKEDIREKDALCLKTHMRSKQLIVELAELTKALNELTADIRRAEDQSTERRNKIQRALHLMSQAELDILKQNQVSKDLRSSQLSLNDSVTRRTSEIEILKVKVHTISGILGMGDIAYHQQTAQLVRLRDELEAEMQRQKRLLSLVHHRRALQLEQIRIEKSLIQESGKCRALEDELEKPVNVHRWRFLEGTNPELSQLLRMIMELRDRLMLKLLVLVRMREEYAKLTETSKVLDKHLRNGYNGVIQDEFDFLNAVLRQKTKQLGMIEDQVFGQTDSLTQQRDQVKTIRSLVRREKEGYFDAKHKVKEFRTGSLNAQSGEQEAPTVEHRLIGGGFAVAGIVKPDAQESLSRPTPLSPPVRKQSLGSPTKMSFGSPSIVQPRSASVLQKKVPRGWNPQRGPLSTLLPTVSGRS
jgi:hypothetical protein